MPKERAILSSDIAAMKAGKLRPFVSKINRVLEERKVNNIHLFERAKEWHCFYYTYSDMYSGHWGEGSHLHYVSHLWPDLRKRQLWESFDNRDYDVPGNIHIRLAPLEMDTEAVNSEYRSLMTEIGHKFKPQQAHE